jgi:hypothetical protein
MGAAYANLILNISLFIAMFITVTRVCKPDLPWLDLKAIFRRVK